jgi:2-phosphoglycerate kinase
VTTLVTGGGAGGAPYSKGLMAQSIMATGVAPARAWELARRIEARLDGRASVSIEALDELVEDALAAEEGDGAVARYRRWRRLDRLDRPLVVLIGGTAGTGKSTVASALAHRLGITRLTATDTIRHILRTFFPSDVMPEVHCSSFEAGHGVRDAPAGEDPDLVGFRRQAEHVGGAVRAIVERAVSERTPLVLEGVHLVPGVLPSGLREQAVVVHAILAVEDEARHRSHFLLRSEAQARGPAARYVERLETIRKLQDHLVEDARRDGVPVIVNASLDGAVAEALRLVLDAIPA